MVLHVRRRVEQLAARRAHNPEAVGSSPTPAKNRIKERLGVRNLMTGPYLF